MSHTSQLTLLIRRKTQPTAQRALRTENNLQRIMFLQQVATSSRTSRLLLIQNILQRRTTLPFSILTTNLTHALGLNIRRFRRPTQRSLPRKRQQQTRRKQRGQQRRTTIGDKRQRHTNHRQNTGHHAHIDNRLRGQPNHDAARRQTHQRISSAQHNTHRAIHQAHIQQQNRQRTQQTQLLTNNGENIVVMRLSQVVVLLTRLTQANAQETTGRQRHLTRIRLVTVSVRTRTPNTENTSHTVRATEHTHQRQHRKRAANLQQRATRSTRQPHHAHKNEAIHHSGTHVTTEHNQQDQGAHTINRGEQRTPNTARNIAVAAVHPRQPHNNRQLRKLRRLNLSDSGELQPVTVTVHLNANNHHSKLHDQRDNQHRVHHKLLVVNPNRDTRNTRHRENAHDQEHDLRRNLRERRLTLRNHRDARSRQHHNAAKNSQTQGGDQQHHRHIPQVSLQTTTVQPTGTSTERRREILQTGSQRRPTTTRGRTRRRSRTLRRCAGTHMPSYRPQLPRIRRGEYTKKVQGWDTVTIPPPRRTRRKHPGHPRSPLQATS